jgi:hypothetical protein
MKWVLAPVMSVALILAAGPADAGQNANGSISVSPTTVPAGGVVHISGSVSTQACSASDAATLTSDSALFPPDGFGPSATRDAQGAFAVDYTIPDSTPAGTYQIGIRCGGGNVGVTASLSVTADPVGGVATGAGGAAGRSATPELALGLGGLMLAAILVLMRRRLVARSS